MVYTVVNHGGGKDDNHNDSQVTTKSGIGFWDLDLELQAVKTILTPSDWSAKVYSACKEDFFHHATTKLIFQRLQALMESSKTYELPTLDFVLSDSKIPQSIRQTLRAALDDNDDNPVVVVKSQGDYDILVSGLANLSRTRALYQATHLAANSLLESEQPTDLAKQITDQLGESLFKLEDNDELLSQITIGKGYNQQAEDAFCRIINGSFDETRLKSGFKEFDERTGGFYRGNLVIFGGNSGGGKCQCFDALIPTSNGVQRIGEIYNSYSNLGDTGWKPVPKGELKVWTREGIKDVSGVFKGEGSTHKITTKWADEFEGLGEHKLYCYDNEKQEFGFKRLDDIKVDTDFVLKTVGTHIFGGDAVPLPYSPPSFPYHAKRYEDVAFYPAILTEELAILFGLIVSEGYKSRDISNSDRKLLETASNIISSSFGCVRPIIPHSSDPDDNGFKIEFKQLLSHYVSAFAGDVLSADRFIPNCIMKASEKIQCTFLRALYEGDGCIYEVNKCGKMGKNSNVWSLEYSSISKRLIYEIKALLENIGIYCNIRTKDTWAANGSETQISKNGYTLYILRESYELFQEKIGFMSERKSSELARCVRAYNRVKDDYNRSIFGYCNEIPLAPVRAYVHRVLKLMEGQTIEVMQGTKWNESLISYRKPIGKYYIFYPKSFITNTLTTTDNHISKYTAQRIITSHFGVSGRSKRTKEVVPVIPEIRALIENDPILKEIRSQINELCSHVWAQVSSVEKKDEVVPVFDLSVPGPHEYAADGLMSHNSLMAVNMLERQFRLGYNVVLASYEMTDQEILIRLLANIGEVDMNRLQNNKLTPAETHQATAAWREFNLIGYEKGNSYHILAPKTETTVPEIGFRVRSMKPDVLILDYINLLGSSSGTQEAQWQALGNIAREAKLLANKLNCVVILLAQIDETYTLRYSKGIKDHANFVLGWIRDQTAIDNRVINIHQMKARNAPLYNFNLIERFDIAQFRDEDQQDRTVWPTEDELLMMELQCQQLGLKLEPTASKEFDKKKLLEAKQVVNNSVETRQERQQASAEKVGKVEQSVTQSLLFSSDDAIPIDFSNVTIKSSSVSLLKKSDTLYEDTV